MKKRRTVKVQSSGEMECYGHTPEDCYRQMETFLDQMPSIKCITRDVWAYTDKESHLQRYAGRMKWMRQLEVA